MDEKIGAYDLPRRFIITAAASNRLAHCWNDLGIEVSAKTDDRIITLKYAEGAPYSWSSKCRVSGVYFTGIGGERVDVTLSVAGPSSVPAGEILLLPFWQTEAKDRLVGSMIVATIVKLSWFTTPLGVLFIAAGVLMLRREHSR